MSTAAALPLVIDPEIRDLCPGLRPEESGLLEASLIAEGCREPLIVWRTETAAILVDGHNRHRICTRRGIQFSTIERQFKSRGDCLLWVINNQLGRRNLAPIDRVPLVERKRDILAAAARVRELLGPAKRDGQVNLPDDVLITGQVRDQLAAEAGVSGKTYEALVAVVDHGAPELVQAVREKKVGASTAAVIAEKPVEEQREIVARGREEILAAAKAIKAATVATNHSAVFDDDGDEWYTPIEVLEAARKVLGEIDLDPACSEPAKPLVKAKVAFTKEDDGLSREWAGRVFVNPPYSMPLIERFVTKLIDEYEAGNVTEAIALVNNCTDTAWFHSLLEKAPHVCLTKGRLKFWRPDRDSFSARQGQAIFYLGDRRDRFVEVFSRFGKVLAAA